MPNEQEFQRPYGVIQAEERLAEELASLEMARRQLECTHPSVIEFHVSSSVFDDHRTVRGLCRKCGGWAVRTDFPNGYESRLLTQTEIDRLQAVEDSYRRESQT